MSVKLPVDRETKRQKYFAFVRFQHAESVPYAVQLFRCVMPRSGFNHLSCPKWRRQLMCIKLRSKTIKKQTILVRVQNTTQVFCSLDSSHLIVFGSFALVNEQRIDAKESISIFMSNKHLLSPGLVVMGRDSRSEGRGFESRHCILDGHFFTYICCKNCIVCLKKTENRRKRGRGWPIFKTFTEYFGLIFVFLSQLAETIVDVF